MSKAKQNDANADESKSPCPTEGCTGKAEWKGVCRSCYGQALRLIEKGLTTWEELEQLGMVSLGSKPFQLQFSKLKRKKEQEQAPLSSLRDPTRCQHGVPDSECSVCSDFRDETSRYLLDRVLDWALANRGTDNEFVRCYTYNHGSIPAILADIKSYLREGIFQKRIVSDDTIAEQEEQLTK